MNFNDIKTERLVLTCMNTKYFKAVNEYAMDPENTRYMLFLPNDSTDDTWEYLKNAENEWKKEYPGFFEFAVVLQNEMIGSVCLFPEEDRETAEIGWVLNRKYWKHGYAYEATEAVMAFARSELGIRHFTARCDKENIGSWRLMEKLGMKRTGEHGGRKNRLSDEERQELQYESEE